MATIEELEARIKRLEDRLLGMNKRNEKLKAKGFETSQKIQQATREFAKANRVVSITRIAKMLDLSTTRVYVEFKALESAGVIENMGQGFGYLSKVYESK